MQCRGLAVLMNQTTRGVAYASASAFMQRAALSSPFRITAANESVLVKHFLMYYKMSIVGRYRIVK